MTYTSLLLVLMLSFTLKRGSRHWFCVGIILSALSSNSFAQQSPANEQPQGVLVLYANDIAKQINFADNLTTQIRLRYTFLNVEQQPVSGSAPTNLNDYGLLVTVGIEAFEQVINSNFKGNVLVNLVSRRQFNDRLNTVDSARRSSISAIFIEASLARQTILLKELKPTAQKLAMLVTPDHLDYYQLQTQKLKPLGIKFEFETLDSQQALPKRLVALTRRADALLAVDDNRIFNRTTIKSILLTLYRNNQFMIGADLKFIRPGSVGTVYSTMQQLTDDAIAEIVKYTKSQALSAPRYCSTFNVAINQRVAESLNLSVKGPQYYVDIIRSTEITLGQSLEVSQ